MKFVPLVLVCLLSVGCATKPVKTTEVHRAEFRSTDYAAFQARRADELQRMGGPFSDRRTAEAKATEEANSRYGEPPPEYTTKWAWGKGAGKAEAQAEVNDTLEKMERNKP